MALSPKQIASKAVIAALPQFINDAKDGVDKYITGRGNKIVKSQKAKEQVDKILAGFKAKMDKLGKKLKSVAEQIEEQDNIDSAHPSDGADF